MLYENTNKIFCINDQKLPVEFNGINGSHMSLSIIEEIWNQLQKYLVSENLSFVPVPV